jgi:integration host factor subunit beta
MNRSDLITRLTDQHPQLQAKVVAESVNIILDSISTALAIGDRIEVRGFGSFGLNYRPPRRGRNPKTGETVMVPAKYLPHFKPGKELRFRVDK